MSALKTETMTADDVSVTRLDPEDLLFYEIFISSQGNIVSEHANVSHLRLTRASYDCGKQRGVMFTHICGKACQVDKVQS